MADTSNYAVAATSYASATETIMAGEVRAAAAAVVANAANWTTLDSIIATGKWLAVPVRTQDT